MRNAYLGTEHLLLGLLSTRCAASDILVNLGVDLAALERKTVELVGARTRPLKGGGEIDMNSLGAAFDRATPRLNQAFDRARIEAAQLHRDEVGTEHLLLGLLHDPASVAAEAIKSLDIDTRAIRDRVKNLYQG